MADRWYTARMATKKKTKRKQTKSKSTAGKKAASMKKSLKMKLAKRRVNPKKKLAKKKAAPKNASATKKLVRGKSQIVDTVAFAPVGLGARAGGQTGGLQELIEGGNAFEAEVVKGVEDAGDADEGEVRTHEVPQDDVPGEYRDKK